MSRGHVCFYAPDLYPVVSNGAVPLAGGAEGQQWHMARLLRDGGFRVTIVTCDYGQARRVEHQGIVFLRTFPPRAGIPGLRYVHPRLTLAVRGLLEANADLY